MWIYLTTWYLPCIVKMKQKQAIHQENVQNHFKMANKGHTKLQEMHTEVRRKVKKQQVNLAWAVIWTQKNLKIMSFVTSKCRIMSWKEN